MNITTIEKTKSVKTLHPCQSVIQTNYDIVNVPGREIKVATKENEGSEFMIQIKLN